MKISMDKKYRTRDGRDVRLLCVDGPDLWPVVGMVNGTLIQWSNVGGYCGTGDSHHTDLIEYHEPEIRTIWVNVYEESVIPYANEGSANARATPSALAIAQPVTFEVKRS